MKITSFPKTTAIIAIQPYHVTLRWSNDEVRTNDLAYLLETYPALQDAQTFLQASIEEGALAWENVQIEVKLASQTLSLPLVLDKQVLYQESLSVGKVEFPRIHENHTASKNIF